MVTQKRSALTARPVYRGGHRHTAQRGWWEQEGGEGGLISAWQMLNSKRTANTLSGTDSSHLVKKLTNSSRN